MFYVCAVDLANFFFLPSFGTQLPKRIWSSQSASSQTLGKSRNRYLRKSAELRSTTTITPSMRAACTTIALRRTVIIIIDHVSFFSFPSFQRCICDYRFHDILFISSWIFKCFHHISALKHPLRHGYKLPHHVIIALIIHYRQEYNNWIIGRSFAFCSSELFRSKFGIREDST